MDVSCLTLSSLAFSSAGRYLFRSRLSATVIVLSHIFAFDKHPHTHTPLPFFAFISHTDNLYPTQPSFTLSAVRSKHQDLRYLTHHCLCWSASSRWLIDRCWHLSKHSIYGEQRRNLSKENRHRGMYESNGQTPYVKHKLIFRTNYSSGFSTTKGTVGHSHTNTRTPEPARRRRGQVIGL